MPDRGGDGSIGAVRTVVEDNVEGDSTDAAACCDGRVVEGGPGNPVASVGLRRGDLTDAWEEMEPRGVRCGATRAEDVEATGRSHMSTDEIEVFGERLNMASATALCRLSSCEEGKNDDGTMVRVFGLFDDSGMLGLSSMGSSSPG